MAEIDSETVKRLADAIKGLSKMDMFPRTNEERSIESLRQTLDDIERGNRSDTKKMVEAYDKAMQKYGVGKDIKDLKAVLEAKDTLPAMQKIMTTLGNLDENQQLTFESYRAAEAAMKDMNKAAESAGTTLTDMGIKTTRFFNTKVGKWEIRVKNHDKVLQNLTKDTNKFADAMEEAAEETERYNRRVSDVKDIMGKFGSAAKMVGKDFLRLAEQEQRFAQQNAVADAGWIDGVTRMQISTIEYMKILKDTRRESLAMSAAGLDFKESLVAGTDSLRSLTFSSEEAAKMSAAFHKNVARMGVGQEDLGDAVLQQTKMYKDHYRVLGYSAEEFSNLTQELINDQGMRSTLLGLQEKERKAYVMGVQQRMAEYQTMGYTIERAKELQKTFQALNQMNPKERMKQAAKTRAMMGAMGMGAEGEELFNLQTRYRTMNAEQKADADKRMAEIQGRAAEKFGAMSGAGTSLGQSMSMQMMAEKTGFTKVAETFETASGEGLKVSQEQLAVMKAQATVNNEISAASSKLLHAQDAWRAAEQTALTSIATNLVSGFTNLASINAAGFAASALASGVGGVGGMGGAAVTGLKGMASAFLPATAAAGIGVAIGSAITGFWKSNDPEGYAESAETFGGTVDTALAWFGNDAAKERLENMAKMKQMQAEDAAKKEAYEKERARQQEEQLEIARQNLEVAKANLEAQTTGADKVAGATEKQTGAVVDATKHGKLDKFGRSTGG